MKAKLLSFPKQKQLACQLSLSTAMSTSPNMLEPLLGPNLNYILKELEDFYPPFTPTPEDTMEKIMYRSGQRSVVEWLANRLNEDN